MSKQIAIPNTITPKPTKTEIIEAMVAVRLKQQEEEYGAALERNGKLRSKAINLLEKHAKKAVRSEKLDLNLGYMGRRTGDLHNVYVSMNLCNLPDEVSSAIKAYHTARVPAKQGAAEIRKEIRARISSGGSSSDRVRALIDSPDSRKAIEESLAAIGMGAKTIEAKEAARA